MTIGELSKVKRKYAQIDFRLAVGLSKILEGPLADTVNRYTKLYKRTYNLPPTGRQILCLIHQHYQSTEDPASLYRPRDLLGVQFVGDNHLEKFLNNWHRVYGGICCDLPESFAEEHFVHELRKSTALKDIIAHYDRLPLGDGDKSYIGLMNSVNAHLLRIKLDHNRSLLLGKGPRNAAPIEPAKDLCPFFKERRCTMGSSCPMSHSRKKKKAAAKKAASEPMIAAPANNPGKGGGSGHAFPKQNQAPAPSNPKGGKPKGNFPKGRGKARRCRSNTPNRNHAAPKGPGFPKGKGGGKSVRPCFAFSEGRCQKGQNCPFAHRQLTPEEFQMKLSYRPRSASPGVVSTDYRPTSRGVCQFYLQGRCHFGNQCQNSHVSLSQLTANSPYASVVSNPTTSVYHSVPNTPSSPAHSVISAAPTSGSFPNIIHPYHLS